MPQIDKFLELLVKTGGSDLHIKVGEPPRLRVNGKLKLLEYPALTKDMMHGLLQEIMSDEQLEAYTQDQDYDFAYAAGDLGRFRVNVYEQRMGRAAVFRIVPTKIPSADDIGLLPAIRQLATLHKGLVLVTGATGSGKSTTLAAIVNLINTNRQAHILTIEDPIEFVHESKKSLVNQREVGNNTQSFTRALRSALREDPDVILVGEMRDIETISLAVTAAETGHLVLATLHTISASKAIDRIVDSFPPDQQQQIKVQLAETLKAVVAQQLLVRKDGRGRAAAFEILLMNAATSNMIRKGETFQLPGVMATHKKDGMQSMDVALADLVRRQLIDPKEALSHAHSRQSLAQELAKDGIQIT
jgi:twitching motility protein PilT